MKVAVTAVEDADGEGKPPEVVPGLNRMSSDIVKTFLVEDSPAIQEVLMEAMELVAPMKFVGLVASEEDAVQWLTTHQDAWHLAIIDLVLHRGTGFGVLQACRERSIMQKVVVLTSYREEDMWQRCRELGADGVFDKSHQIEELVDFCRVHAAYLKFISETDAAAEQLAEQRAIFPT